MHTENHIDINGPADRIYALAADIAAWPRWLPHYRWVRVLEEPGGRRVADMGALRNRFPCRWRAVQERFPEDRRITFRHIGGITRGMWVEWRIAPAASGCVHVSILHDLTYPVPILGPLFARTIVGRVFVHYIAGRTLACLKRRVEHEAMAVTEKGGSAPCDAVS